MERMNVSFDMAIEQAGDAVMITSLGGVIQYVNRAFERTVGYSRAEVVGQHTRILRSGAHDPAFYRHLWVTLTRGQTWRGTMVSRRKDGRLSPIETVISPLRDEVGCVMMYMAVMRDVTHERQAEVRRRRREAMTLLKALTGGLAHDVNNVLTTVVGLAEMLEARASGARATWEEVSELKAVCDRATSFTRQLLALGQRGGSRHDVLDLNEVVSRIEKMLRRILGDRCRVGVMRSPEPATARVRPGEVEEAILEMALRARDAMPSGGTFSVAIRHAGSPLPERPRQGSSGDGTGWIEVRVTDTALGASADESAVVGVDDGCAGVYAWEAVHIAQRVDEKIRRESGHLVLSGDTGTGTTFALYFPHVAVDGAVDREAVREPRTPTAPPTVLLAEDEDGVRELVRAGLTRLGYRVLDAPDGATAMERALLDSEPIELLITDVVMPGMSGQELADRVVALHPTVRVIYMSGYPPEIVGNPRLGRRKTQFLQKPFTRERLLSAVRETLERK